MQMFSAEQGENMYDLLRKFIFYFFKKEILEEYSYEIQKLIHIEKQIEPKQIDSNPRNCFIVPPTKLYKMKEYVQRCSVPKLDFRISEKSIKEKLAYNLLKSIEEYIEYKDFTIGKNLDKVFEARIFVFCHE